MAWIESHQDLDDHPKTRKAALILGINVPSVIGHLHILWHWAVSYAPDGDLTDFTLDDIALAARWDGDPEQFVNALLNCRLGAGRVGFLERGEDGRLVIHDWWEYAGKLIVKRQMDAQRKRGERLRPVHRTSGGHPMDGAKCPMDGAGTHHTTPTVPNSTPQTPQTAENDSAWAAAAKSFENEIGLLSGSIIPEMLDMWSLLESNGTPSWWQAAIAIAAASNKRSWSYVRGILQNCLQRGQAPGNGAPPAPKRKRQQEYDDAGNLVWKEVVQ